MTELSTFRLFVGTPGMTDYDVFVVPRIQDSKGTALTQAKFFGELTIDETDAILDTIRRVVRNNSNNVERVECTCPTCTARKQMQISITKLLDRLKEEDVEMILKEAPPSIDVDAIIQKESK